MPNKLWKIRDILEKDEKTGRYLIDWEDDPVTKEKYPRTWVCIATLAKKIYSDVVVGSAMLIVLSNQKNLTDNAANRSPSISLMRKLLAIGKRRSRLKLALIGLHKDRSTAISSLLRRLNVEVKLSRKIVRSLSRLRLLIAHQVH